MTDAATTANAVSSAGGDRSQRQVILDQLRACAIISVVIYHVVAMSPVPLPEISRVTWYGQYGVDLFFVLSGWLIGGLYWREQKTFGGVDVQRFWARRWMRTLPPYAVALLLSWLAVWFARGEAFDWRYLIFLQNYYLNIPFFLVSWSLCIEEHFYLGAPVLAGIAFSVLSRRRLVVAWMILIATSPLLRWSEWDGADSEGFGYFDTATHLRLDGLVLGFGLSHISVFEPKFFARMTRWSTPVIVICAIGLWALEALGGVTKYVFWPAVVVTLCAALLLRGLHQSDRASGALKRDLIPWKAVALASYSAYLVHPLCIHVVRIAFTTRWSELWLLYWPAVFALIAVATAACYVCVERPSIALRDILVPSRKQRPPADHVPV